MPSTCLRLPTVYLQPVISPQLQTTGVFLTTSNSPPKLTMLKTALILFTDSLIVLSMSLKSNSILLLARARNKMESLCLYSLFHTTYQQILSFLLHIILHFNYTAPSLVNTRQNPHYPLSELSPQPVWGPPRGSPLP